MQEFFEPATESRLSGKFWLLIVDGHASYILNKFIQCIQAKKIVCLCLPLHSTHFLHPLDVRIFGLLKQNYKKPIAKKTKFSTYNIDKTDFIGLIKRARWQGISSQNIKSAWRATELISFNSSVILQKLAVYKKSLSASSTITTSSLNNALITSSVTRVRSRFFSIRFPPTPEQVKEIEELVFHDQTLDSPKLTLLNKTLKAARLAIGDRIFLNCTNTELLAANLQKKTTS